MLTGLDTILFPDNCEVVEIPLHNQWVYLIQKNGSSSIRKQLDEDHLTLFVNQQIYELDFVDVYIRNSKERYVSGVNTYLQHLKRDYPELDQSTAFWFVKRYQFLNRHYLPQFHWLVNLSRFISPDTKIRLRNFKDIGLITDYNRVAGITPCTVDFSEKLLNNNPGMDLWFFADQILYDLSGSEMSWKQIIKHYQTKHSSTFNIMCNRFNQIVNCVLP
jgi:hypothetical protein